MAAPVLEQIETSLYQTQTLDLREALQLITSALNHGPKRLDVQQRLACCRLIVETNPHSDITIDAKHPPSTLLRCALQNLSAISNWILESTTNQDDSSDDALAALLQHQLLMMKAVQILIDHIPAEGIPTDISLSIIHQSLALLHSACRFFVLEPCYVTQALSLMLDAAGVVATCTSQLTKASPPPPPSLLLQQLPQVFERLSTTIEQLINQGCSILIKSGVRGGEASSSSNLGSTHAVNTLTSTVLTLLKTLQAFLQLVKSATINSPSQEVPLTVLVPCLQRAMIYNPPVQYERKPSQVILPPSTTLSASASAPMSTTMAANTSSSRSNTSGSPAKYVPPARRRTSASGATTPRHSDSDKESGSEYDYGAYSSSGGTGSSGKNIRVRTVALTCMQLIIKANPKAMHPMWATLLPANNPVTSGGVSKKSSTPLSLAHILLYDTSTKVRHAAAATLSTLLEGPAQRAYLSIAEAKHMDRQPVRGFITLSSSLGHAIIWLHQALLKSLSQEKDSMVLCAVLHALCTLLVGAPYHRLPLELLPTCAEGLSACAASASSVAGSAPGCSVSVPLESVSVLTGSISCMAAMFGVKPSSPSLDTWLLKQVPSPQRGVVVPNLLLQCAEHASPAVQLESAMALRGLAQNYPVALREVNGGCWETVLRLSVEGLEAALARTEGKEQQLPTSTGRATQDGSPAEKVASQRIRLASDLLSCHPFLSSSDEEQQQRPLNASDISLSQWQDFIETVLIPAASHRSSVIRSAALSALAMPPPDVVQRFTPETEACLLQLVCTAAVEDDTSSVRATACKTLAAVLLLPAVVLHPAFNNNNNNSLLGETMSTAVVAALEAASNDTVLAVRIQATAAIAALCACFRTLSLTNEGDERGVYSLLVQSTAPVLLQLSTGATRDNEKVRMHGVYAIGSLLAATGFCLYQQNQNDSLPILDVDLGLGVLIHCLGRHNNIKVQWAACEAAGWVLEAAKFATTNEWLKCLVDELCEMLCTSENVRTRTLIATAFQNVRRSSSSPSTMTDSKEMYGFWREMINHMIASCDAVLSGASQVAVNDDSVEVVEQNIPRVLLDAVAEAHHSLTAMC